MPADFKCPSAPECSHSDDSIDTHNATIQPRALSTCLPTTASYRTSGRITSNQEALRESDLSLKRQAAPRAALFPAPTLPAGPPAHDRSTIHGCAFAQDGPGPR